MNHSRPAATCTDALPVHHKATEKVTQPCTFTQFFGWKQKVQDGFVLGFVTKVCKDNPIGGFTVVKLCTHLTRLTPTWKSGDEERVKPSDPGCRTNGRPPGVSWASVALNATSPNTVAWVSGWALSCGNSEGQTLDVVSASSARQEAVFTASYQDFKSVQEGRGVRQAAVLLVGGVVLGDVTICPSAEENFLDAAGEGLTQVLDWIHHHAAVDCCA